MFISMFISYENFPPTFEINTKIHRLIFNWYIQGVSKGSLQNFGGGIGHITRIQNCIGTYVPKRHLNPLRTMCFRLYFKRCGRGF